MRLLPAAKLRRSKLNLESLEGREVPASVVTVTNAGGLLSLIGNDEGSGVRLKVEAAQVTVTPDATTDVGGGNGVAQVFAGTATSLVADMKGGDDAIDIDPASAFILTGAATFKMGDGNSFIFMNTTAKIDLGSLSVTTGDGFDSLSIAGGVGLGSKVSGNATFDFKNGPADVNFADIDFPGAGGVKVKVATKGGSASVNLSNVDVAKTLDIVSGDGVFGGSAAIDSALGGVKIKGTFAGIFLDNTTVNGKVDLSSPTYIASLGLNDSTITGDTKLTAFLVSYLQSDGISKTGKVSISGNYAAQLGAFGTSLKIDGDLSVHGKTITDVQFDTTALSEVTGKVAIKGGGLIGAQIAATSFFKVGKDLSVDMEGPGGGVILGDGTDVVTIGGNLKIKGSGGDSFIQLTSVSVAKNTSIKLGAGADVVLIGEESVFAGKFDADLGAGDDVLLVGVALGATAPVTFTGKATIKMGDGNDTLELGEGTALPGDANSKAVFGAGSKIDGGKGFNTFDDGPAESFYTGLVFGTSIVNFTDPVP